MKKKEKSLVIPTIYLLILFFITICVYFTSKAYHYDEIGLDNITYVSSGMFSRSIPILNEADNIHEPVSESGIPIVRFYYSASSDLDRKEKSIVFYENTYMPNTGIDYQREEVFDIIAIYDGTVVDVGEDELLGKTVKIKHNGEVISVYQGIDNIEIKTGDVVFTGQKIATSGTSKINKDLGNHLHFEMYKDGVTINPENCFNQKIGDI